MVEDRDVYKDLSKESKRKYKRDIFNKYGRKSYQNATKSIKKMSKEEWAEYQYDLNAIFQEIALAMTKHSFKDETIQNMISEHHSIIERLNPSPKESYIELAKLYSHNEDFIIFFDKYEKGFSQFLEQSMSYFAKNNLE